ncbi:FecR family protein [Devosia chinhatensis]|nr:FecR family protein [Devosia chinhatensis]
MRMGKSAILAVMLAAISTSTLAQDWVAERLRGTVLQLEGGEWTSMERGAIVPDGQTIKTAADGRAELVRGQERISLAGNTQISIRDSAGQKMTTVLQTLGSVTIEAERRNVQHFSVQTPVLAAVVKGTSFTVTYSNGRARVDVERGIVQVQDRGHEMVVDVSAGQSAEASQSRPVDVTGPGSDKTVFLIEGNVVPAAARSAVLKGDLAAAEALGALGNGNSRNTASNRNDAASNAGGNNGNGNAGGNNGNGNAGGNNGNGNAGGNSGNSNAGGNNGNGNAGGNSGNGNAGGNNGNGNAGGNNGNGNAGGNNGNGNAGGNNGNSNAGRNH